MRWWSRRRRSERDLRLWSTADLEEVRADFDRKRAALRELQANIVAELEARRPASRGRVSSTVRVVLEPATIDAEARRDG